MYRKTINTHLEEEFNNPGKNEILAYGEKSKSLNKVNTYLKSEKEENFVGLQKPSTKTRIETFNEATSLA